MCFRCLQKQSGGNSLIFFILLLVMLYGRMIEIPLEFLGFIKKTPYGTQNSVRETFPQCWVTIHSHQINNYSVILTCIFSGFIFDR